MRPEVASAPAPNIFVHNSKGAGEVGEHLLRLLLPHQPLQQTDTSPLSLSPILSDFRA
jgi:hypothetical protein